MSAEATRHLVETWAEGGVDALIPLVHPAFEGEVGPETSIEPDTYVGHAGVRRYFALWDEAIDDLTPELISVEEVGPDTAVAELRVSGRGAGSGAPAEFVAWTSFAFERGLLRRMQGVADRETALRVAHRARVDPA